MRERRNRGNHRRNSTAGTNVAFTETIKLTGLRPVGTGVRRHVYAIPDHPGLLIKIIPSWKVYTHGWLKRQVYRLLPNRRYRSILAEVEYEMQLSLRLGTACSTSPLPKCFGVVSTDLGAGVLVEKIVDRSGALGRTLYDLCAGNEMDRYRLGHLNELVAKLFVMHIVTPDLHPNNVVFGQRNGKDSFFVVDGYGERTVIPMRSLSRSLHNYSLQRQMTRIAARTGLIWSAGDRQFSIPE